MSIRIIHRKGYFLLKTNIACERYNGIAVAQDGDTRKVAQLRCKQWHCPYCARKNAEQWRAAIIDYVNNSNHHWSFLTLTLADWVHKMHKDHVYDTGVHFIRVHWDRLMKRLKRWLGKFQYVRILESHKSGVIHVHLLVSTWIPDSYLVVRDDGSKYNRSAILEAHLKDCGFGYIHDARNLESPKTGNKYHAGSVAAYVTKYMTKDLAKHDSERKKRRVNKIQTSRGIKRVNLDKQLSWQLKSGVYLDEFLNSPYQYHDVTTGSLITLDHFRGGVVYPPVVND